MNNRGPWDYESDTSKVSWNISAHIKNDKYLQSTTLEQRQRLMTGQILAGPVDVQEGCSPEKENKYLKH